MKEREPSYPRTDPGGHAKARRRFGSVPHHEMFMRHGHPKRVSQKQP